MTDAPARLNPAVLGAYLVCDAGTCPDQNMVPIVAAAAAGGVRMIQLRAKDLPAAEFLAQTIAAAHAIAEATPGDAPDAGVTLVINDRVDVYLAARDAGTPVHGVHIGQSDLPADAVRALIGPDAVIGLSANRPHHLDNLAALPAGTVDYLGAGAIRPTPTKKNHPEPLGWDGFAAFTAEIARRFGPAAPPTVSIGSVTKDDAAAARAAGSAGLAVVRAICLADDPQQAAADLVAAWEASAPGHAR